MLLSLLLCLLSCSVRCVFFLALAMFVLVYFDLGVVELVGVRDCVARVIVVVVK